MKYLFLIALIMICTVVADARAEVRTGVVEYSQGGKALEGYLAYDDTIIGKRPAVLVVHEWVGINPYIRQRTEQLAKLGYIAFAADIYGKGIRPQNPKEAAAQAAIYKSDRKLMRARAEAGLDVLRKHQLTDPGRIAAIGYCFGGTTVLELARSGADVAGTVSFHGGLDTPNPADAKNVKGKILALHGADDPVVPVKDVLAFQDEMRKAGVDWQMNIYGGAVHSFTNPASGNDNTKGVAYNEKADKRSWEAMKLFFSEIFR